MPWCPNCKAEYQEGFKTCFDCNVALVDGLKPIENNKKCNNRDAAGESFLISLDDPVEAEMIESILNSSTIPVLKKFRQAGGFLDIYMGTTVFGVDLYVPAELLEKAQDIVGSRREVIKDTSPSEEYQKYKSRRRIRVWIILLLFIPGIFWMVIGGLYCFYLSMME